MIKYFTIIIILLPILLFAQERNERVPTTMDEMFGKGNYKIQTEPSLNKVVEGKWMQGSNMPFPRYYGGSVMYTRNDTTWLYVLGGDTTGSGVATASCLKYNLNTDTWQYIAPLPEPLRTNTAAILGDKIYTMGGFNAPFPSPALTSFYVYDINTNTWSQLTDLPAPLFFSGAVGYKDSLIYIMGGIEDVSYMPGDLWSVKVRVYIEDFDNFEDATDMPEATANFGYANYGDNLIITAGLKNEQDLWNFTALGKIDIDDYTRIDWSLRTNYPLSVHAHYGAAFPNNEVYFGGGSISTGFSPISNVYGYSLDADEYKPEVDLQVSGMAYYAGVNYNPNQRSTTEVIKYVIAGGIIPGPTLSNQTWIYTDTVEVLGINQIGDNIPQAFTLSQNYPNPFNPETKIKFSIPEQAYTTLEIFNVLGEKITTLISEELSAGSYKYKWNAEDLNSGIYIYKITSGNFTLSKKMILLK